MRRVLTVLALATLGCSGGGASSVMEGWRQDGLEPSSFTEAAGDALGGGKCSAGTVASVDTTLCEFADDGAAKKAERAGEKFIGDATGISMSAGKMLLVVVDRKKLDPEGRKMNQIAQSFRMRAL